MVSKCHDSIKTGNMMTNDPLRNVFGQVAVLIWARIEMEIFASSSIHCTTLCLAGNLCESFAYNKNTKLCRFLSGGCDGNQHADGPGWKSFTLQLP